MRILLSQLDTARKSGPLGAGEKDRDVMVSVGGSLSATSDFKSPRVLVLAAGVLPKMPDMVVELEGRDAGLC